MYKDRFPYKTILENLEVSLYKDILKGFKWIYIFISNYSRRVQIRGIWALYLGEYKQYEALWEFIFF